MPDVTLTVKLQIYPTEKEKSVLLNNMKLYAQACTWLSEQAFKIGIFSANKLQKLFYDTIRKNFKLKSQMAISVTRTVAAKYETIKTYLKSHPAYFKDEEKDKTYKYNRNLNWLLKPVVFSTPQLDLVRKRDWCFADKNNQSLSLNTIEGRITVKCNTKAHEQFFDEKSHEKKWKFGTGRIVVKNNKWYFYISATKSFAESSIDHTIVGIDRGLRYPVYAADTNGNSYSESGEELRKKRDKYQKTRRSLQSKNTKGAKRVLKRISGRENRWMADVNHCTSKTLVERYAPGTRFIVEDLTDVSFDEKNMHTKEQTYELRSWTFYDLEMKLEYKAHMKHCKLDRVSAKYTSQRCPKCGTIRKESRNRDKHIYSCPVCKFTANDDYTAALNIMQLGVRLANGEENPKYSKGAA